MLPDHRDSRAGYAPGGAATDGAAPGGEEQCTLDQDVPLFFILFILLLQAVTRRMQLGRGDDVAYK